MKTNFKVGQTAYFAPSGQLKSLKGKITEINHKKDYAITFITLDGEKYFFTPDGKFEIDDEVPTLSHTPYIVKLEGYSQIELKELPDLKKDDLVMVSNKGESWMRRRFSHFNEGGQICCFVRGWSSTETDEINTWERYELLKNK